MKVSNFGQRVKALSILGLLVTGLAATIGHSSQDAYETELRKRAQKIFAHDRTGSALPSNQLYSLSIALQFRDLQGAEVLVSSLEKQMRSN